MIFKAGYWGQVMFVRDRLSSLFYNSFEEWENHPVRVVGGHTSKSIRLPVFSILIPHLLEVRLRANFHNWVVSVASTFAAPDTFLDLFERGKQHPETCSEGFEPGWVFGPYASDQCRFSLCLTNEFQLYTFCYLLLSGLKMRGGLKP